jgi:hypothetical protein
MDDVTVATPDAPSTPDAVVAAPETPVVATPAPARPTSMQEAFKRAEAKSAAPTGTATIQPATDGASPAITKGPIPFESHETILRNAREKTRAEVMAEVQGKYGWAEHVDRATVEQAVELGKLYSTDKAAFVRQLFGDNPDRAVVAEAARFLGQQRGQTDVDTEPDIPVSDANGQIVARTYSAEKVQAIVAKAVQDAIAKEVGPLKQDHEARQHQAALQQITTTAEAQAKSVMARLSTYDGFQANKAEIAKVFRDHPEFTPEQAYLDVLHRVILPSRDRTSQAQTMASLKDKAVAQVETTTGTAATPGKRPTTPQALARFMASRQR